MDMVRKITKEMVIKEYVLEQDYDTIMSFTENNKKAISFRAAGGVALQKLREGAGAKKHNVLEKSVKVGSLKSDPEFLKFLNNGSSKDENETLKEYLAENYFSGIEGLVAHWNNGKINGLYLTEIGVTELSSREPFKNHIEDMAKGAKALIFEKNDGFIKEIPNISHWQSWFFTGDYDMHDMVDISTKGTVLADVGQEGSIIAGLNMALSNEKQVTSDYNKIQHGPQYNYIAHTFSLEKGEFIVPAVANPGCPIAMCDNGEWLIIDNIGDLDKWYTSKGMRMKEIWKNEFSENMIKLIHPVNIYNSIYEEVREEIKQKLGGDYKNEIALLNVWKVEGKFENAIKVSQNRDKYSDIRESSEVTEKSFLEFVDKMKLLYVDNFVKKTVHECNSEEAFKTKMVHLFSYPRLKDSETACTSIFRGSEPQKYDEYIRKINFKEVYEELNAEKAPKK